MRVFGHGEEVFDDLGCTCREEGRRRRGQEIEMNAIAMGKKECVTPLNCTLR